MDEDQILEYVPAEPHFKAPHSLRDKHRNLDSLVQIALQTNEDPLVLAADAGVSPSALLRALPRSFLSQFVPNADALTIHDIMLRLASNHALDVAVCSVVGQELDARTMVSMSKDLLDRASVVGHKVAPATARIALNDDSLAKLAELERSFIHAHSPLPGPGSISPEFESFHRTGKRLTEEQRSQAQSPGDWQGPVHPRVRDLEFDTET